MRTLRSLLCALALTMTLVSAPAPADDGGSATCANSAFNTRRLCHLWFRGFPLLVSGTTADVGGAWVRVWISLDVDGLVPVVECTATGRARTCSNGFPDETTRPPWYGAANAVPLYCHIDGEPRWLFACVSGSGQ